MTIEAARKKLRQFFNSNRRLPSYREMCEIFNFASKKAAFDLAKKLIKAGIIAKDNTGKLIPRQLVSPLPVLGFIKAGSPTPAEEQLYDTMSFDQFVVNNPENSYILKVSGDSMIEAGINSGDLVIVEKKEQINDGDIVVANIDGEFTLKFFAKENGHVCLVPANKKYPKLYPQQELNIAGIVVTVIRKYH
ncbi:MAG: transcriptional repressor LexA [Candidatus Gottesmanbacteria bacterium]